MIEKRRIVGQMTMAVFAVLPLLALCAGQTTPTRSSGTYLGHKWRIDENHLMWWDGKPYVRFGFTGNGDLEQMSGLGFNQFTLMPAEEWAISGPDEKISQGMNETTDQLERMRASYYALLNTFWPWRYGNLTTDEDKVTVFVRDVVDVSKRAGRRDAVTVTVRMPIHRAEHDKATILRTYAVLFDLQEKTHRDLSSFVERVDPMRAEAAVPSDDLSAEGKPYRVRLGVVALPKSQHLRLVVGMEMLMHDLPHVNGLPPLWKQGIREYYQRSLTAFRRAYAKPGLRGMMFGDEINTYPVSLLTSRAYVDIRRDAVVLGAYHAWLTKRFGDIERFNAYLGSRHSTFNQVEWIVPLHPFTHDLIRSDDADATRYGEPWAKLSNGYGLFRTVDQFRKTSELQEEFRVWFYGHCLAEYAKEAKHVIGNVPVFTCSASILGEADRYLAIHRWALLEGVDGLSRNHYGGYLDEEERLALASVAGWMSKVQAESGRTKHLFANEIGYIHARDSDEEPVVSDAEAAKAFGIQWAFPTKQRLCETLHLLSDNGYRGFHRFLMNPSASEVHSEVMWMRDMKQEVFQRTVLKARNRD